MIHISEAVPPVGREGDGVPWITEPIGAVLARRAKGLGGYVAGRTGGSDAEGQSREESAGGRRLPFRLSSRGRGAGRAGDASGKASRRGSIEPTGESWGESRGRRRHTGTGPFNRDVASAPPGRSEPEP